MAHHSSATSACLTACTMITRIPVVRQCSQTGSWLDRSKAPTILFLSEALRDAAGKGVHPSKDGKALHHARHKLLQHVSTMMPGAGWAQQVHDLMQRCRAGWAQPAAQYRRYMSRYIRLANLCGSPAFRSASFPSACPPVPDELGACNIGRVLHDAQGRLWMCLSRALCNRISATSRCSPNPNT